MTFALSLLGDELVWGEEPPVNGLKSLQVLVSRTIDGAKLPECLDQPIGMNAGCSRHCHVSFENGLAAAATVGGHGFAEPTSRFHGPVLAYPPLYCRPASPYWRPGRRGLALPRWPHGAHNGAVTDGQQLAEPCPQCGSSAAVHSIGELAVQAQAQLNQAGQSFRSANPQQGWEAEPQAGPQPGWAQQPQAGPPPGSWVGRGRDYYGTSAGDGIGDAIADAALGAVGGFLGRAIGRRVQKAMSERVIPTLAANRETMLRQQIEIAQRHPDLRACLTDKVVFLAGGGSVLPMPNLMTVTADQADALVAQLRSG